MANSQHKQFFIERHEGGERAIIVHLDLYPAQHMDSFAEFKELARSAGVEILAEVIGKRSKPEPKYFVGLGKAEEIQQVVKQNDAEVVLVNHQLTPAQGRNLEKLFDCRVIDRSELILDIFAQRARTHEGKLQVELAQLQHISTRLIRGWTHLERQKGGIGLRGPGETQLESDRRMIGVRIKNIKKRLEKVVKQREQSRRGRKRAEMPTISLVGYTNAGKSTLFNQLTQATVYAADQLFATLDPTLRTIQLPAYGKAVLADTVGFIRELPHDLVAAFRATLEESRQADLLIHVVDYANPDYLETIRQVNLVLEEIGAHKVPQLLVYNKIDLKGAEPRIDYNEQGKPERVWVSALAQEGFDGLFKAITELLNLQVKQYQITLPPTEAALRASLYAIGAVLEESLDEAHCWQLKVAVPLEWYERIKCYFSS